MYWQRFVCDKTTSKSHNISRSCIFMHMPINVQWYMTFSAEETSLSALSPCTDPNGIILVCCCRKLSPRQDSRFENDCKLEMPPHREQTSSFEKKSPLNSKSCNSSETQQTACYLDLDQMTLILKLDRHDGDLLTCHK